MASNRNNTSQARKVMVVADPTRESAGALQYALSHAVIEQDELILLHVENPSSWRNTISTFLKMPSLGSSTTASLDLGGGGAAAATAEGEVDFLEEMKHACRFSQPKMRVRALRVEMDGKDRASTILSQSKTQGVDVIVIGQKRSLSSALLGYKRPGGGSMKGARMIDTAEYLIQNSPCTCVGVQRKGQIKWRLCSQYKNSQKFLALSLKASHQMDPSNNPMPVIFHLWDCLWSTMFCRTAENNQFQN